MKGTKERILETALILFSEKGFDSVSVSEISGKLGITKGALYKHYLNKRDIFASIISKMEKLDEEHAKTFNLPSKTIENAKSQYENASVGDLKDFAFAQFKYWTEDVFASAFRKMLTVEQFRSDEMRKLYLQYVAEGPMKYVEDIYVSNNIPDAKVKSVELYAAMFIYYTIYDGASDKKRVNDEFKEYLDKVAVN